ncbi:hypothetical protein D3C81_814160 [compost metagenome]
MPHCAITVLSRSAGRWLTNIRPRPYFRPSRAILRMAPCAAAYSASPRSGTYLCASSHTRRTGSRSRSVGVWLTLYRNNRRASAAVNGPATSLGRPETSRMRRSLAASSASPTNCPRIVERVAESLVQLLIMKRMRGSRRRTASLSTTDLNFWLKSVADIALPSALTAWRNLM